MSEVPCEVCALPGCVLVRHVDEVLSHGDARRFAQVVLDDSAFESPRTRMLARYILSLPDPEPQHRSRRDEITGEELEAAVSSGLELLGGTPKFAAGRQALAMHVATQLDVPDCDVTCDLQWRIDQYVIRVVARDTVVHA